MQIVSGANLGSEARTETLERASWYYASTGEISMTWRSWDETPNVEASGIIAIEVRADPFQIATRNLLTLTTIASPVTLSFGNIPLLVEPSAERLLSRLPGASLQQVLAAVRQWVKSAPIKAIRVCSISEPDARGWEEVFLEISVRAETDAALRLWDELASSVHQVKEGLPDQHHRLLDRHFGIHIVWED